MPSVIAGLVGGSLVSGIYGANKASSSANRAAAAQTTANNQALAQNQAQFESSQALQERLAGMANSTQLRMAGMSIAEQRRQFAEVQRVLSPFVNAGNQALTDLKPYEQAGQLALQGQQNLIGLGGADAQQAAIDQLAGGVQMQALTQQGESAILQNASATGGLRGGNTQSALAQFRPAALSALIDNQYAKLGGLTQLGAATTGSIAQLGQASAAQQASSAMALGQGINSAFGNAASNIAQLSSQNANAIGNINAQYGANQQALTTQAGQIAAGNALAQGSAYSNLANSLGSGFTTMAFLNSLKGTTGIGATGANYAANAVNNSQMTGLTGF